MNERLEHVYEINKSLLELTENLQDEFSKKKIKKEDLSPDVLLLCFFFAKASKTASAVFKLCRQGYTEDACALVRTIFEIVVKCLYIFKEDADKKAKNFILHDKYERRKQLEKVVKWNRKIDLENKEFEDELESVKRECIILEEDFKISKKTIAWPHLEVLSEEVGLGNKYYTIYWLSSLYVHTLVRSSRSFVLETDSGLSFYIGPDEKLSEDVLIWSFDLFRLIVSEFDSRFSLGYKERILQIEAEFNKIMQQIVNN